jgi:hypothetical protein
VKKDYVQADVSPPFYIFSQLRFRSQKKTHCHRDDTYHRAGDLSDAKSISGFPDANHVGGQGGEQQDYPRNQQYSSERFIVHGISPFPEKERLKHYSIVVKPLHLRFLMKHNSS